jgi:hypothetical protein
MRHRNVWATGLALGLGLGAAGFAAGQDPAAGGNWFSRLFSRNNSTANHKEEEKGLTPPTLIRASREQALTDYLRRLAVCDKLRDIGMENGSQELIDRARLLEDRAKDAYVQRTNRAGMVPISADEDTLHNHLAPRDAGALTNQGSSKANSQASAGANR